MPASPLSWVPSNWYASNGTPAPQAYLEYEDMAGVSHAVLFDLVVKEDWPDEGADITEHPVETGADIADHVRVRLPKCELTIRSTNEPITQSNSGQGFVDQTNASPLALQVPVISRVPVSTTVNYLSWNNPIRLRALLATAAGVGGSLAGGTTGGAIGAIGAEVLASLLDPAAAVPVTQGTDAGLGIQTQTEAVATPNVVQWPSGTDYVAAMHALLVQLKSAAQVFTVVGTKQVEENMVIESLSFSRSNETGSGEDITIGLKQVLVVTTQVVPAPIPNLSGGGGKPTPSMGGQDPTKLSESAFLSALNYGLKAFGQPPLSGLPSGLAP